MNDEGPKTLSGLTAVTHEQAKNLPPWQRWFLYVMIPAVVGMGGWQALEIGRDVLQRWPQFSENVTTNTQTIEDMASELRGHHDTLSVLKDIDEDLHMIQNTIIELKAAQEEYQDSALANRQRSFCRSNPTEC